MAFSSTHAAPVFRLFSKAADGGDETIPLGSNPERITFPRSWLSDGSGIVIDARGDLGILHLSPEPREEILLGSAFDELEPSVSPDGRFLAYVSETDGEGAMQELNVVVNWVEEVKALDPDRR